jgi:hypothetical protein
MDKRISNMVMLAVFAVFMALMSLLPTIGAITNAHK